MHGVTPVRRTSPDGKLMGPLAQAQLHKAGVSALQAWRACPQPAQRRAGRKSQEFVWALQFARLQGLPEVVWQRSCTHANSQLCLTPGPRDSPLCCSSSAQLARLPGLPRMLREAPVSGCSSSNTAACRSCRGAYCTCGHSSTVTPHPAQHPCSEQHTKPACTRTCRPYMSSPSIGWPK